MSENQVNTSSILHGLLSKKNDKPTPSNTETQKNTLSEQDATLKDLQAQTDELTALGISVMDQLSLEKNVEAAVSKVIDYLFC